MNNQPFTDGSSDDTVMVVLRQNVATQTRRKRTGVALFVAGLLIIGIYLVVGIISQSETTTASIITSGLAGGLCGSLMGHGAARFEIAKRMRKRYLDDIERLKSDRL